MKRPDRLSMETACTSAATGVRRRTTATDTSDLHPERSCGRRGGLSRRHADLHHPKSRERLGGSATRLAISTLSTAAEGMLQVEVTSASGEHLEARRAIRRDGARALFVD